MIVQKLTYLDWDYVLFIYEVLTETPDTSLKLIR